MRIVTWNVLGLTGYPPEAAAAELGRPGDPEHLDHFAAVFASLGSDVLALQEGVEHRLAQDLARRLQRHLATFPSPGAWSGHVLSRDPILESRTFSHAGGGLLPFSRTCGAALLRVAGEHLLWVVCAHLHPGDADLRSREADLLRRRLEELLATTPHVVVLGDFNCEVPERPHLHLRELGFLNAVATAVGGLHPTMDTAGVETWRIDHIYLSPSLSPSLSGAAVVRDPGFRTDPPRPPGVWDPSDHLPVRTDLDWPEP